MNKFKKGLLVGIIAFSSVSLPFLTYAVDIQVKRVNYETGLITKRDEIRAQFLSYFENLRERLNAWRNEK